MHRPEEAEPVSTIPAIFMLRALCAVFAFFANHRLAFAPNAASDGQSAILTRRGVGAYRTEVRPSAQIVCDLSCPPC